MEAIFSPFKNWRFDVLFALGAIAFVCLFSEADTPTVFLGSKLAGIALAVATLVLGRAWRNKLPKILMEE